MRGRVLKPDRFFVHKKSVGFENPTLHSKQIRVLNRHSVVIHPRTVGVHANQH